MTLQENVRREFYRSLVTALTIVVVLAVATYIFPKTPAEPLCQCQPCATGDVREGRPVRPVGN